MTLSKRKPAEELLIFFHIGKTAGTTLDAILRRNFSNETMLSLNYGENPRCVAELKDLPEARKAALRYLHAHMLPFGIHAYLPAATYIVLLRDPVERVISEYFYIRQTQAHPLHGLLTSQNMSLRDYLTGDVATAAVQSGQTRLLSGVAGVDWVTGTGPLSRDILEIAKQNLQRHFKLVGLTERFDEFLILLKHALHWKNANLLYQKRNVTPDRPRKQDIPEDTLKLIETCNEFDLELYDFARRRFNESIRAQGPSFGLELQLFRAQNRAYNQLLKLKSAVRPLKRAWSRG